jgi:hypothetical protein
VTEQETKRKPGRPPKGKRGNFTFRVTERLREQLISEAEASGLSVSEEIERRLDQSFNDAPIRDLLGGSHTNALILTIAAAIQMVEIESGKKWIEDHDTNLAMRAAVNGVMELLNTPPRKCPACFGLKVWSTLKFPETTPLRRSRRRGRRDEDSKGATSS